MIKKDIFDKDVKAQFKASAKDRIHRFMMADKTIKGAIIHSTRMIREMQANHNLGPLETLVLGQAYIAAGLLCSTLKENSERVSIQIQCSGPIKGLDVESNFFGEVRGYLKTNEIQVENPDRIKYLSTLYGAGFLTVTRYVESASRPYSGQVALEYGSVAEDLANYFLVSEQIPTGFKLSLFFDDTQTLQGAGGIFLQALPGADPQKVVRAEQMIQAIDSLGQMFANGMEPEQVIKESFPDLDPVFSTSRRVEFFCRCSKEKMEKYIKTLPKAERKELMTNGPFPLEVCCHHCNSFYYFDQDDLRGLDK
ncbi:MAG: Hsp33 family molecular chaperone HslO [Pseudomonadota bacterium]